MPAQTLKPLVTPGIDLYAISEENDMTYQSLNNDPFFVLSRPGKGFKAGWYVLSYDFHLTEGNIYSPKVYFDFGHGFNEKYHWKLFYQPGRVFGLVKVPWDCTQLRLDISEHNIKFKAGSLKIRKLHRILAFFYVFVLAKKLGQSRTQLFREFMRSKGLKAKRIYLKALSDGSYFSFHYQDYAMPVKSAPAELPIQEILKYSTFRTSVMEKFAASKAAYLSALAKTPPSAAAPTVDILIPVYNGLKHIEKLLPQIIERTDLPYNLYIIDDCSTDNNVPAFLEKITAGHENIQVSRNETNLGFTLTVNKLFEKCTNEFIVLLNTDIQVPDRWLSRLLQPFHTNPMIGSITPMSNCATICSFPNMGDNPILDGYDVNLLNSRLETIDPYYEEIPTGVGFCFALRRSVLLKTGIFDSRNFPRGYGEEVDLCFRIRKHGYINVLNAGLFVVHEHGGSFLSEEKLRLMSENQKKVETLHPEFTETLMQYFEENSYILVKVALLIRLAKSEGQQISLFLDHDLGGGTNVFASNHIAHHPKTTFVYCQYINPNNNPNKLFLCTISFRNYSLKFGLQHIGLLFSLFQSYGLQLDEMIVNDLVSYPTPLSFISSLAEFKASSNVRLLYFCHDFFALCPNFLLFRENEEFCNLPTQQTVCNKCLSNIDKVIDPKLIVPEFNGLPDWRAKWGRFLINSADSIVAFSNSTEALYLRLWPELMGKIKVQPHQLVGFRKYPKKVINIGILGNIHSVAKGARFVNDLAKYIKARNLDNFILTSIGAIHPDYDHPLIRKTGFYKLESLHFKLLENGIDVIFIPSICSETFSFTTREAIETGIPTACFNFGGQYDQVAAYSRGIVIPGIDPEAFIHHIEKYFKENAENE